MKFEPSRPDSYELMLAVTKTCGDHNLHFKSKMWAALSGAFDWYNAWPVVDGRGFLTGDVVDFDEADDLDLLNVDNWATISRSDAEEHGWAVDEEGNAEFPTS